RKDKKAHVSLTALQKKEICEHLETDKTLKQKDIAVEYGISNSKHAQKATFEDIEEAMKIWVENILVQNDLNLSDSLLMEKVLVFAKEFEVSDKLLASTGWTKNFKRRNNLKSYKKRGESGSVDMNEIPRFRE
ncbi:7317_t:CDS:2, partial [Ambispora gerdemannii]